MVMPIRRLVIDGRRLGPGRTGVGRYLEVLLDAWSRVGLPIRPTLVATRTPIAPEHRAEHPEIDWTTPGPRHPAFLWERWGLGRILRAGDLLFAPANLIPDTWGGPTVLVLHDTLHARARGTHGGPIRNARDAWYVSRYRSAARRATHLIAPSKQSSFDIADVYRIDPRRITVIPPGIPDDLNPLPKDDPQRRQLRERLDLGDRPFLLSVGKRSKRRHLDAVVETVARLQVDQAAPQLILVGPRARDTVMNVPVFVSDLGYVDESTLRVLYAEALALVLVSDYEGFGIPIAEALAMGCPVIARPEGALPEAGGAAVHWIDSAEPDAIAEAVRFIQHDDPKQRAVRRQQGLDHVQAFRATHVAEAVARVFDKLTQEKQ